MNGQHVPIYYAHSRILQDARLQCVGAFVGGPRAAGLAQSVARAVAVEGPAAAQARPPCRLNGPAVRLSIYAVGTVAHAVPAVADSSASAHRNRPETMAEFGVKYRADTAPPAAAAGMVVHSMFDISAYAGEEVEMQYLRANTDEELAAALRDMPKATVTFYELPEGEKFFMM